MATASKVIYYNTEYGDYNHMFDGAPDIITEDLLPILPSPFFGIKHTGWYTSPTFEENTKVTAGYNLTDITLTLYAKWESVPCLVQGESLRSIAETIREKAGTNEKLKFPDGFINIINNLNKVETCSINLTGIYDGVIGFMTVDEDGNPKYVVEDFYSGKYKEPVPIVKNSFMYIFHLNANYNHSFSDTITILRQGPDSYNGLSSKAYIYGIHGDGYIYFQKTGSSGEK